MPIEDIKVTPIEKNNIKTKATIPLNPTAQGWSGEQVRNRILQGSVGETDSVLSLLESKMDIVHNFIANIYDGDIDSVLIFDTYETMVASTPKTNILYLVKTPTVLYYYDSEFKELYSVDTYTKDETYNQTEIDAFNLLKANASEVFSKEETYNRDTIKDLVADVPNKANIVILQSITTQPATATVGQIYYNAYDKKIYLYDGSDWGVNNVGANGILYMFNNVLYVYNSVDKLIKIGQKPTNFDSLIVDSLHNSGAATFDNEVGIRELTVSGATIFQSGLSANGNKIVNVLAGVDNNDAVNVKQLADVIAGDLSEHYKKVETYSRDEIIDLIASNYKAKGNLAPAGLVAGLLVKANLGNVYNITGQFTTTINFLEGAGIIHEAGENVAIVEYSAGVYKFDVLSSFVDLSGYVEKDGTKVLSDNNFTTTLKNKLDGAEITSNKVTSWSSTTDNTRYPSEKLVKDSLDVINVGLENIGNLSPLRFAGYFTGGTVVNDFNNLIRPFENLTEALPDFYINNIKGAMFVCNAASDFVFNTVYTWVDGVKTTPITFNWAAPYDEGLGTFNFEVGDTISILNFAYDTVENEMFILVKVEKSSGVKADKVIPASTGNIPKLNASGNLEDSGFKLEKSVPSNAVFTDTVPTVPTISTDIETDETSDIKTTSPKAVKTYVDNTISTAIGDIDAILDSILGV